MNIRLFLITTLLLIVGVAAVATSLDEVAEPLVLSSSTANGQPQFGSGDGR